jgi:flagellar basal-body rod modification protein FlgD
MPTTTLNTSNLGTTVSSTTATTASGSTNSSENAQDRFLTLLVAQLNNQDPMNPMDNAQMTTQMTQISTVSGIEQLNATLKSMSEQYGAMQAMQGTSLIGHHAVIDGSSLYFDGSTAQGAVELSAAAGQVTVDIIGTSGAVIDSVSMGALGAGQHAFTWDATGVAAVSREDGSLRLQLADGKRLTYDQVDAFM